MAVGRISGGALGVAPPGNMGAVTSNVADIVTALKVVSPPKSVKASIAA